MVDQQSQIVWQLRKRGIITPRVLKWLTGTIRDYNCQLSPLAPHWTTESDRCEEREPSAPTLFIITKHTPTSEYGCAYTMAYEEGFGIAIAIFICSRDSEDPRGYRRMDRLGTLRRPADLACISKAQRGSIDVSYPHVGLDSIWFSDSPNWV